MRGITRSVTIDVNFSCPVNSPFGETRMGFTGQLKINREDFDIMLNEPPESGGFIVGNDSEVIMDSETDLTTEQRFPVRTAI